MCLIRAVAWHYAESISMYTAHKFIATYVLLTVTLPVFSQNLTENYPQRAIQMHVPFRPGGTTDLMARLLQDELGEALGTAAAPAAIAVVNTAGAGGMIGMANVARAKPDGYTIAMTATSPQTLQPTRRDADFKAVVKTHGLMEK